MKDIVTLFRVHVLKDIFIPGHMRMAFVTFNVAQNAQNAVRKLNNSWSVLLLSITFNTMYDVVLLSIQVLWS